MKHQVIISLATVILVGSAFALRGPRASSADQTASVKPLTYANVVSHFKDARLRTSEVQKRCTVFFEGEWKNRDIYNYGLIIVENSDEDVQVTFYLTDAHEMNWLTEFLVPYDAFAAGLGDYKILTTLCPGGKERMRRLMSIVQSKRFDPTALITHRFTLDNIVEAYDLFASKRDSVLKVAIRP